MSKWGEEDTHWQFARDGVFGDEGRKAVLFANIFCIDLVYRSGRIFVNVFVLLNIFI
jgi:hypothetical protein